MEEKRITTEILETKWHHLGKWIEPALAAEVWLEYGHGAQRFFKCSLDGKILYLNGDFFLSQHDVDGIQQESYVATKSHDEQFFETIEKEVSQVCKKLVAAVHSIASIPDYLERYKELTAVWMPLNIVATGIEKYIQEIAPEALHLTKGYIEEKPWTLEQIDEMHQLQRKIEKAIGKKLERESEIPSDLKNEVEAHVKRYEWLGSHHFNVDHFTLTKLVEKMQQGTQATAVEQKSQTPEVAYLVDLLDRIGYVRFKCAETSGYVTYYLKPHLVALGQPHQLSYKDVVEHTLGEIENNRFTKAIVVARKRATGFYYNGKECLLSVEQVETCHKKLLQPEVNGSGTFKGLVAQRGKATGIVKIVTRQDQMKGFENGMILVAHETTPDVIFAMQKSAAIVTDFGGLTSHAAIVARELKKPCIVGTRVATQVLKDGDLVEVDADKGIVRILDKAYAKN